jgi:hypothetical protein
MTPLDDVIINLRFIKFNLFLSLGIHAKHERKLHKRINKIN